MEGLERRQLPTRAGGGILSSILNTILPTVTLPVDTPTLLPAPTVTTTSISRPVLSLPSSSSAVVLTSVITTSSSVVPSSTLPTSQTPIIESTPTSSSITEVSTERPTSTVTNFQSAELASSSVARSSNTSPPTNSFLNNKPLAGFVFGLVGLVVLVIIFTGATFALRRRRNRRLMDEAVVSFEPTVTRGPFDDERGLTEKRHSDGSISGSPISGSNMSHGPFRQQPVAPHQQFYDRDQGYGYSAYGHQTYALPSQMANDAYGGIQQPSDNHFNVVNAAAPATTHSNNNLFYQ